MGLIYGSIFLLIFPGKYPRSSSTVTIGLVIINFWIFSCFNCSTAYTQANNVLPVPAGPTPIVNVLFFILST